MPVCKSRSVAFVGLALLAVGLLLPGRAAQAEPGAFSYRGELEIGRPARAATVVLDQAGDQVEIDAEGARAFLPLADAQRADLQTVKLASGAVVGLVRVTAAESREAAALLVRKNGRVEVLWTGALDPRGDPGERRGHMIELQDQTGDGQPDVVIGEFDERARICGQPRTLVRPHAVDPQSLKLRKVVLSRLPAPQAEVETLTLAPESPGPTQPPLLRSLRLVGVSSQPGTGDEPLLATLPRALTDADPSTFWSEGQGGGGRGEFATFHWDGAGYEIRALAIVPLPAGVPGERRLSVPRRLSLVTDGGRFELKLPERVNPGERYWVSLPKPLESGCLSLVFEETAPVKGSKPGLAVLAEVEAYTELDFGGGVDRLVRQLSEGGARASQAAQLLSTLGPGVVEELREVWPTLQSPGRRRVVRVLSQYAEREAPARALLASALDDADEEVRADAFDALVEAGPGGRAVIVPRVAKPDDAGDAAALALAREAPAETIGPLLAALDGEAGSQRAALREALALCCRAGGSEVIDRMRAFVESGATVGARASLALALSAVQAPESARSLASELVASTVGRAEQFEDLWRLVQAARALASSAEVDAWLAELAKNDERWMLRAAAIEALAEREAEQRAVVAASALDDPYPRVRAAAAAALASHTQAHEALAQHALRDRWPLVRAAALEAIAEQPGGLAVLRKGVGDAARVARAAAIRGLTRIHAREAWPLVKERLESKEEWPEVLTESVRFASELCVEDARNALLSLVRRGMKPDAWAPDAELGLLSFEALMRLGGDAAKSAVALTRTGAAPPSYRAAADAGRGKQFGCEVAR